MGKPRASAYLPYSIATDCGVHRRCVPELAASSMSWLGEPPTAAQSRRYEAHRLIVMREELARVTAVHSLAAGRERAGLAGAMADLHSAIGQASGAAVAAREEVSIGPEVLDGR